MKYAILSDLHIGAGYEDRCSLCVVNRLRKEGYQLIFLGDVYDFWRNENADRIQVLKPGDWFVRGNHDFFYKPPEGVLYFENSVLIHSGNKLFYLSHGDAVDFAWAFKLLSEHSGPWYVRLLSYFNRWTVSDYQRLYAALEYLPDSVVHAFEHGGPQQKLRQVRWLYALWHAMWRGRPNKAIPKHNNAVADDGPVVTFDTKHILRRILWYDRMAAAADEIIIGHLHAPMRKYERYNGHLYNVTVLGAWIGEAPRVYATIENGKLRLREATCETFTA